MTVTVAQYPEFTPLVSDGNSPSALWECRITAVGDAGGGNLEARVEPTQRMLFRYLWNVSGFNIYGTLGPTYAITLDTCRRFTGGTQTTVLSHVGQLLDVGSGAPSMGEMGRLSLRDHIFLPVRNPVTAFIRCLILNGAGRSIDFAVWGYVWDRDVLTTPGGPRFP